MDNTRGKGPFAKRSRPVASAPRAPHWLAPRCELTDENLAEFMAWIQRRADAGFVKLFATLAAMRPEHRLARNLSETLRQMTAVDISDALQDSLSDIEHSALYQFELAGIPVDLLSVAHCLLSVRERQTLVTTFCDDMLISRNSSIHRAGNGA